MPSRTVMVAEDELLVRMFAASILSDAGFQVVEATHAAHALSILDIKADDIHVLFTDVNMPGSMDGLELAHHVRRSWPRIAILIASGAVHPLASELPHGSRFLPKPYEADHVLEHVWALVAD